jgi:putative transposase
VFAWRARQGKGLPGEPVREILIEAVDKRFGSLQALPADHRLAFLSDNGSAYIAADTRALARSLCLKPINTPVCSPQSNGIAEHFDEVHPHSSLKMRSPREFRRHPAAQARCSTVREAVLHCEWDGSGDMGARSQGVLRANLLVVASIKV